MGKKRRDEARAAERATPRTGRRASWLVALLLLAAGGSAVALAVRSRARLPETSTSIAPARSPSVPPDPQKLVGRWLRNDYDYMIVIRSVAPDGMMDAQYLNPQPIKVSRAEAKLQGGELSLLVELRDQGYPGSYYTLSYDPVGDNLYGVYHHLGRREDFDVAFFRFAEPEGKAAR